MRGSPISRRPGLEAPRPCRRRHPGRRRRASAAAEQLGRRADSPGWPGCALTHDGAAGGERGRGVAARHAECEGKLLAATHGDRSERDTSPAQVRPRGHAPVGVGVVDGRRRGRRPSVTSSAKRRSWKVVRRSSPVRRARQVGLCCGDRDQSSAAAASRASADRPRAIRPARAGAVATPARPPRARAAGRARLRVVTSAWYAVSRRHRAPPSSGWAGEVDGRSRSPPTTARGCSARRCRR